MCRGLGAVDALTGQLTYTQAAHISTKRLVQFYHSCDAVEKLDRKTVQCETEAASSNSAGVASLSDE
jgi:hypothetical protein